MRNNIAFLNQYPSVWSIVYPTEYFTHILLNFLPSRGYSVASSNIIQETGCITFCHRVIKTDEFTRTFLPHESLHSRKLSRGVQITAIDFQLSSLQVWLPILAIPFLITIQIYRGKGQRGRSFRATADLGLGQLHAASLTRCVDLAQSGEW